MRLFDDFKNLFDSNGNIRANVWVEWQHEITTQGHCGICLVALFESLGFTVDDSEYIQKEFERQAVENYCNSKYQLGRLDENGQRINIDINFQKNGKEITFISGWMVRPKGAITCNTPLGG